MKNSAKHLLIATLTATLAALGLTAFAAPAQGKLADLNFVTVALTVDSQGSFSDDGTIRIYAEPVSRRVSTKDLLNQLARDKFAQSNYAANFFPSGSRLALSGGACVVVDRNGQLLVDVSDILQFSSGTNGILSGRVNDTTGLASRKTTERILVSLAFDDTFIPGGGSLSFFVQGLDTLKTKDSKPAGGFYQEATSDLVKNATGEGQTSGMSFVVSGAIQGSRNATLPLP